MSVLIVCSVLFCSNCCIIPTFSLTEAWWDFFGLTIEGLHSMKSKSDCVPHWFCICKLSNRWEQTFTCMLNQETEIWERLDVPLITIWSWFLHFLIKNAFGKLKDNFFPSCGTYVIALGNVCKPLKYFRLFC